MRERPTAAANSSTVLLRPLLLLALLVFSACGSAPGASHYATVLDQLSYPSTWQLVHTTTMRFGGPHKAIDPARSSDDIDCAICLSVTRYFVVAGSPADGFAEANQFMASDGFTIRSESGPGCDLSEDFACALDAIDGPDHLSVNFYYPGVQAEGIGAPDNGHFVVRITADHS